MNRYDALSFDNAVLAVKNMSTGASKINAMGKTTPPYAAKLISGLVKRDSTALIAGSSKLIASQLKAKGNHRVATSRVVNGVSVIVYVTVLSGTSVSNTILRCLRAQVYFERTRFIASCHTTQLFHRTTAQMRHDFTVKSANRFRIFRNGAKHAICHHNFILTVQ